MRVHIADIHRSDFVYSIPYMFVRLRVNWIACGIAVGVLFTFSMYLVVAEDKVNFRWIVVVAVMAVVGGDALRHALLYRNYCGNGKEGWFTRSI
jgi:hypothetical protein